MKLNIKKINTGIVLFSVLFILAYVALSIIFPSFSYYIKKTDKFKVSILKKSFGGKEFLSITPLYDYPYNSIKVKINLQNGADIFEDELPLFYGYEAEFYPISSQNISTSDELKEYLFFDNKTEISNGTLISNEEAVFFISRGQARPFLGPEVFVRLGFDWDHVTEDQKKLISSFDTGEKLNFTSAHPDGTILEFADGKLYLVWGAQLIEITNDVLGGYPDNFRTIKISQQEEIPIGYCVIKKNKTNRINCEVANVKEYNATGHTYLFGIPEDFSKRSVDAKIRFNMLGNFDPAVARESLKRIKDELSLRYSKDITK